MADAKAKTINLLLYDGDLNGVISIEESNWNSGALYLAPRESVSELIETGACNKYGIYLLLSKNMVYVGQYSDLSKIITQHLSEKDWWESVLILTTNDNSFTHTDIDYLESLIIDKALKMKCLDCDNKNKKNNPKVSKFQKIVLDQYLSEVLFLMKLIGITVFNKKKDSSLNHISDTRMKLAIGKRAKADAINFLKTKGIEVNKPTYAKKSQDKNEFWANPQTHLLNEDWWMILNNNETMELIVLFISANLLSRDLGLKVRVDKHELLDLNINCNTFIDRKSGIDFSPYIRERVKY